MDKVTLSDGQAKAIEWLREDGWIDFEIVGHHYTSSWEATATVHLNGLSADILIRALYIGYGVEKTVEEQILEVWCKMGYSEFGSVFRQGIETVLNITGMKVPGINDKEE